MAVKNKNKTVVKSLDILNLFLKHSELNLNEMVQLSRIPKTSVHRMISSLEDMGFLQRDEQGQYSLGLLFLQYGQLVADRLDIREISTPIMKALRNDVDEAVKLTIKDGREVVCIEQLDTTHPVRLYTKIGQRSPLYAGASSRILLAFSPTNDREQYLKEIELIPISFGTITDKAKLRRILEESVKVGFTVSQAELADYTCSVAAPIFNNTGKVVAGISIIGPDERFHKDRLPKLIDKVKIASSTISKKLGWDKSEYPTVV